MEPSKNERIYGSKDRKRNSIADVNRGHTHHHAHVRRERSMFLRFQTPPLDHGTLVYNRSPSPQSRVALRSFSLSRLAVRCSDRLFKRKLHSPCDEGPCAYSASGGSGVGGQESSIALPFFPYESYVGQLVVLPPRHLNCTTG